MVWDIGHYIEEMVLEIYASYFATLQCQQDRRVAVAKNASLDYVRVCSKRVGIFLTAIYRFLYGADVDATWIPLITVFDYQWKLIKDGRFQREHELGKFIRLFIAQSLSVNGEAVDWVLEPKESIKKANLTFIAKYFWLLVRLFVFSTSSYNIVNWDIAVLMAAMIAGFEVDFAWLLQAVMHRRAFKSTTTYPFPCIVFVL